jgi:serine/threonine-protein kinase RsbT
MEQARMMPADHDGVTMPLRSFVDVIKVCQHGKELAASLHFKPIELIKITTAISEIARNTVLYAKAGHITVCRIQEGEKRGLMVVVQDDGPGIPDVALAMQDGYSTLGSLGIGLSGAKRLVDEFEIVSEVGKGTAITMKKWKR